MENLSTVQKDHNWCLNMAFFRNSFISILFCNNSRFWLVSRNIRWVWYVLIESTNAQPLFQWFWFRFGHSNITVILLKCFFFYLSLRVVSHKPNYKVMPSSHCMVFKVIRSLLFSHCRTIWGSIQSLLCSRGSRAGGYTLHDFTIERISDNSVCSANHSQTHTRSEKENNARSR